jgi:hypothetical protein
MIYLVFFSDAGVPKLLLTPAIVTCKKVADGQDVADPPAVTEIGGGFYKFTAAPAEALVVTVDGGAELADADRYKVMQITPHDADLDAAVSTRSTATQGATAGELAAAQAAIEAAIAALHNVTVAEVLAGNLADDQVFAAGSLADRLRKLHWMLCNKLSIIDNTGAFTAYKDDGVTPAATGVIADNGTTTTRGVPSWP